MMEKHDWVEGFVIGGLTVGFATMVSLWLLGLL